MDYSHPAAERWVPVPPSIPLLADKFLIIHADDLGVARSVNAATYAAMKCGAITSASIMAPCPWFLDAAKNARAMGCDIGVHLTLTSEWPKFRWGPLASSSFGTDLTGSDGYFHARLQPSAEIPEAILLQELERQICAVRASGVALSHLDSHMYSIFGRLEWFLTYQKLAEKYGLHYFGLEGLWQGQLMDGVLIKCQETKVREYHARAVLGETDWLEFYCDTVAALQPGVNLLTVHLGYDSEELRLLMDAEVPWGSRWRQRDLDVITSRIFRNHLEGCGVRLISWRDVGASNAKEIND